MVILLNSDDGIARIFGLLKERELFIQDPKALQHIFMKDQHIYEEMTSFVANNKLVFGDGIASILGEHHKRQRKMLNPAFSTAHMKLMTSQFLEVTYKVRVRVHFWLVRLSLFSATSFSCVELMEWLTRTALEIVAQSAFGTTWDPVTEGHNEHRFISSAKLLGYVPPPHHSDAFEPFSYEFIQGLPAYTRFLTSLYPSKNLRKMFEIGDTMTEISLELFNEKKAALETGSAAFKNNHTDILSILMEANSKASDADKLPDTEVVAQISTLTFAAMDTNSSALCRLFWLLAKHQDVQDKLRAEIREAKHNFDGEPTYDQLAGLAYLDAVCRETLRLYPPAATIGREYVDHSLFPLLRADSSTIDVFTLARTRKDAILPLSKPIKMADGRYEKYLWGPDSYEWKPERWLTPIPDKLVEARIPGVYSHLMTFIGGGRSCIEFRFSEMEMKAIVYVLIDHFRFSPSKQEITWIMGGLTTPSVDPNQLKPQMPLLVSRAA
ncbi:hypothetical protein EST38_g2743 [Candolleomyces aberdarensis]|uniref:Cytochrome P450 n=1 Tax=Candolleomyces aberdarensis TaxID=2316362 RepID=A0A4Q2DUT8_9AGAR|nr:hypothetical protein EST38_g2743 [Candolleomyces aberdarensis]